SLPLFRAWKARVETGLAPSQTAEQLCSPVVLRRARLHATRAIPTRRRCWPPASAHPRSSLIRPEVLPVTQVHHVLQHGRAGRQIRRGKKLSVEIVVTGRRTIDQVAALEGPSRVLCVVQTDQRSPIAKRGWAPVLNVAQEVVYSAIGSEILARSSGLREIHVLTACDRHAIKGVCGLTISHAEGIFHAIEVRPIIREQGHRIGDDSSSSVRDIG